MNEEIKARLEKAGLSYATGGLEVAALVNDVFDPENSIGAPIVNAIFKTAVVDRNEDYDYFVADQETKVVRTLTSGGITQTNVTPNTETTLTFTKRTSEHDYVYLDDVLDAKDDIIARRAEALTEGMDRIDEYDAISCIDSAVESARKFTLDSGQTRFRYPDLTEMVNSIAEYARLGLVPESNDIESNLVLVTGKNITKDILDWSFDDDKNVRHTLAMAGVRTWITIPGYQVTINGTPTDILDADVAYLAAPDFTPRKETAHFVRRRTRDLNGNEKERIVVSTGPLTQVGTALKWAFGIVGAQATGCVVVNPKPFSKFTRS